MPTVFRTIQILYNVIYTLIYWSLYLGNLSVCLFLRRESDSIELYIKQIHTRLGVSSVKWIF